MPHEGPPENGIHPLSGSSAPDYTGKIISHYRVVVKLGGGMSIVYKARDIRLNRDVVLKFLPMEMIRNPRAKRRFEQEARAASLLKHVNICTVYDFDEYEGQPFMIMEFLEGETLKKRLAQGPENLNWLLRISEQIASALDLAHRHGIIHRDIKPGNIFITDDGQVKLLDFGVAKLIDRNIIHVDSSADTLEFQEKMDASVTDALIGTVAYMSPEQARADRVDARSDLFSLGIVIYEMACGIRPFEGINTQTLIRSILNDDPVPLSSRNPQVPPALETLARTALQKDPDLRYQSASDLSSDLLRIKQQVNTGTTQDTPVAGIKSKLPGHRLKNGFKYVLGILAVLVIVIGLRYYIKHETGGFPNTRTGYISIAVLPFEDLSEQQDNRYFCDGISEELINALSKVKSLRVAARTSAFAFREMKQDIREIGERLNVASVVEGTVRKTGDQVRVDARLVGVADGYTAWSERFDLKMENIFEVQEQIAQSIVEALKIKFPNNRRLMDSSTRSTEAHQLFLKGRFEWSTRTPKGLQESIRFYNEAIAIDPNYAAAYAAMADSYYDLAEYGIVSGRIIMPKAKASALKAIEIDSQLAVAHATLGLSLAAYDYDWEEAGQELKRAVELNPGSAAVHHWYGLYLAWLGKFDQAINEINLALELDPLSANVGRAKGTIYSYSRQPDKAIKEFRAMAGVAPNFFGWYLGMGDAFIQKKMYSSAVESLERATTLSDNSPLVAGVLGFAYARARNLTAVEELRRQFDNLSGQMYVPAISYLLLELGLENKERALELLEKSREERSPLLVWVKVDYKLDFIRSDPRFIEFMQRMNFPR
jgi:serine/threonine protein kinase/tetratricopeptide (TPR) repeat protein